MTDRTWLVQSERSQAWFAEPHRTAEMPAPRRRDARRMTAVPVPGARSIVGHDPTQEERVHHLAWQVGNRVGQDLPDDALPGWLHFYNHHRLHSAIGNQPPVSRLTNLPGHHT